MSYSVVSNYAVNSNVLEFNKGTSSIESDSLIWGVKDDAMEENVIKKSGHIFNDFTNTFKGSVNGKKVHLDSKAQGMTVFADTNVSGTIDGKEFNVVQKGSESLFSVDRTFQGEYNGRVFDLKIEKGGFLNSKTSIVGTIDGQEVKFDLNGGDVPVDEEVQDIISTILMLNGQEVKQKDGVFNGVKSSDWKEKENAEMEMCMASLPSDSYTPTWHYDTLGAPVFY